MKKSLRAPLAALVLSTAAIIAADVRPAWPQAVSLVVVDVAEVAKGYRASKLIGSNVQNDANDKIGSLDDIVIDKDRALFAIIQVGGFLGIGSQLVAVPYTSLNLQEDQNGRVKIVLPGASKDELKKLPAFRYAGT